jgi:soluble lytic murein transglycosylase-like protein
MHAIGNLNRMYSVVRGLLAFVGLAAVLALALPVPHQTMLQHVSAVVRADDSVGVVAATGAIQGAVAETPQEREQRALTEFIARRYRVSEAAAGGFVATAYQAGHEFSVDPLLILAVMAVESRYNPVAESAMGAKGLMQIIPKYHPEKLADHGGELALLDPEVNILVGTRILREYLRRVGELEPALQMYAGASDEPNSQYSVKVLAEKARLQQVRLRARNQA